MSQGHGPHGTHSFGLPIELTEASLVRCFSRRKNVMYYGILVPGTYQYVPSFLNTAQPRLQKHTLPRLDRPTLNDLQQDQLEKASYIMCACTEPIGAGIGVVCVERGRPKWPSTKLTDTKKQTHTKKKKGTLHASHDPL